MRSRARKIENASSHEAGVLRELAFPGGLRSRELRQSLHGRTCGVPREELARVAHRHQSTARLPVLAGAPQNRPPSGRNCEEVASAPYTRFTAASIPMLEPRAPHQPTRPIHACANRTNHTMAANSSQATHSGSSIVTLLRLSTTSLEDTSWTPSATPF